MTQQDVRDLIEDLRRVGTDTAEGEVTSSAQKFPKNLRETLSAFANTSGGTIILGLDETNGFTPVPSFDAKRISDALERMCAEDMHPTVHASISIVPYEDTKLVTAHIEECPAVDKPCYVKAKGKYCGSFLRIGDGDHKLTNYHVDRLGQNSTQPRVSFPKLTVTFAMYTGTDKSSDPSGQRFLDSATLAKPIPYLIHESVSRVQSNMRIGGMVMGAFRRDLPDCPPVAVREAVENALIHRDYSPLTRGSQVQVNMYADPLEIVKPGGLFSPVTVETLTSGRGVAATRKQYLSSIVKSVSYPDGGFVVENRGSGYQEIQRQLEHELLPPPYPKNKIESFSLTFSRRAMTAAERGKFV